MRKTFEQRLAAITDRAVEESVVEIGDQLTVRYGSPTQRLVAELGLYARHLATWTCDSEEFGAVRPLKDLLNDAALVIQIQGCR